MNAQSKTNIRASSLMLVMLLSLALLLSACGGTPSLAAATSYIARVTDAPPSARVGIVVEEGKFAVYICSLDDAFNLKAARWYSGDIGSDGKVSGVSPDGVNFEGTVDGDSFTGTVTDLEGHVWNFSGSSVAAGGPAGLYRGVTTYNGQEIVVGSVIDPDGSFASTVQYRGQIAFVTPVNGSPLRVDNTTIKVTLGDPSQQVEVKLVATLKGVELF